MIAIESNPKLLTEYGRAFAYINLVEFLLEKAILFTGKINLLDGGLQKKLLEGKTLGQKIDLADGLLEPKLVEKLKLLNKKRIMLAHGITGQKMTLEPGKISLGEHSVGLGKKELPLTFDSMNEIVGLAENISTKLLESFEDNMGTIDFEQEESY